MTDFLIPLKFHLIYNASNMSLCSVISFLFIISYLKKREMGKLFLGISFISFSIAYAITSLTFLLPTSPLLIAAQIAYRWFEALGLILISYIVIKQLL
ncbi:MAG: hypothetical protein KAS39_06580, partial [Actinomycetia bacterium]|nr:hypothetical protein [Actinomycetes bacterium]